VQRPNSSRAVSGDLGYTSGYGLHTLDAGRELLSLRACVG
jgi:hypothetical protein